MEQAQLNERRQWLFIALAGLFVTNAVTAELISNKLIQIPLKGFLFGHQFGPFTTIIGILPWPVVFLLTDLLNEFYGQKAVRRLSWITAGLIAYCFLIVGLSMAIPAYEIKGSKLARPQMRLTIWFLVRHRQSLSGVSSPFLSRKF
ncbi:MAG: hypothetical protein RL098_1094 [Bacteroidota bacterium]